SVTQQGAGTLEPAQVNHPDAPPSVLVLIRRPYATTSGAELLALFAGRIQKLVVGQHQMSSVRGDQATGSIDPPFLQAIELGEQVFRFEHHSIADHAGDLWVQNPRGDLAQDELGVADDNGVSGVCPTLVANHEIGPFCQDVNQLPFSLVSPLRPNHHDAAGPRVEHLGSLVENNKRAPRGAPASSGKAIARRRKGQFDTMALPICSAVESERSCAVSSGV